MGLTETAVKRPVATLMAYLVILTLGLAGLRYLPIDLLPAIEFPQLTVAVDYPNVGPQEIEQIITEPVENAVAGVPGVERIRSSSSQGYSRVTLDFSRSTNLDEAANDLRAALDPLRSWFPPEATPPRVWKFDPNNTPIVVIGASSPTRDLQELTLLLDREIARRFEQIPGVGTIDIWGGVYRQVLVELRRDRLNASELTSEDVRAALARSNVNVAGGNVYSGTQQLYVRTMGEFGSLDQVADTVIATIAGRPIRVRDVADVSFGYEDLDRVVRIDDRPMVRLGIRKQTGANTVAVAEEIRAEIARINAERDDLRLFVSTDQSTFIERSIDNVRDSALWGAFLAVVVLYAFLRRGSSTFIIAVSIPISIIATFGLLYFNGLTLNQMSFGGLALGVGLIVDNAVVVLENVTRWRDEGHDPRTSVLRGTHQVAGAIVASTLTTIVIFLPVIFMETISGVIFQQLALVVTFSLLCSLFVALTLVPMLASLLLRRPGRTRSGAKASTAAPGTENLTRTEAAYGHILARAIKHRPTVLIVTTVLVVGSFAVAPLIPVELAPQTDADEIDVDLVMADGTNVAVVNAFLREMEPLVRRELPEGSILHFTTDVRDGRGEIELTLAPDSPIGASALAERIRGAVAHQIPGADIRVDAQTGLWVLRRIFGSGGEEDVTVQLRGHDLAQSTRTARQIQLAMEQIPGLSGVRVETTTGQLESRLVLDRAKLAEMGLSVQSVAEVVQTNLGGSRAGEYRLGGDEFPIVVRLRPEDRRTAEDLNNIPLRLPDGTVIPLTAVVDRQSALAPPEIDRVDGQRVTYITAALGEDMALGDAVAAIRERVANLTLPPGYSVYFGGEYEEQQKAAADFRLSLVVALLLVYMVMAGQFERFLDPLVVLCSVPLAAIGVVPTLLLTGTTINMQSLMGIVMLTGIVVNNAIVLIDYTNQLRREGKSPGDAVLAAGRRRLRPILMTTLTTVLGLLPLALGFGTGAEIQAALARVVLGGLIASTIITLVFIPVLYLSAHALLARRPAKSEPVSGEWAPAAGQ